MPISGTILRLHCHSRLVLHPCTPNLRNHQNSFPFFFNIWTIYRGCFANVVFANVFPCVTWVCLWMHVIVVVCTRLWLSACNFSRIRMHLQLCTCFCMLVSCVGMRKKLSEGSSRCFPMQFHQKDVFLVPTEYRQRKKIQALSKSRWPSGQEDELQILRLRVRISLISCKKDSLREFICLLRNRFDIVANFD